MKVEVFAIPENVIQKKNGEYSCFHPLNPLDLPSNTQLFLYNRIVMPPSSLVSQARVQGEYWQSVKESWLELRHNYQQIPEQLTLPIGAFYGAKTI